MVSIFTHASTCLLGITFGALMLPRLASPSNSEPDTVPEYFFVTETGGPAVWFKDNLAPGMRAFITYEGNEQELSRLRFSEYRAGV